MTALASLTPEEELQDWIGSVAEDPYKWVLGAYPWMEPGTALEGQSGPDKWQEAFLRKLGEDIKARKFNGKDPVKPIRKAVSSGHGPGKSTMAAWLVDFIMSTRPFCRGTVTANNYTQMQTKTWAAVQKWTGLCITAHWFTVTNEKIYQRDNPKTWFCALQSSKDENSEAFAGQHAADSSSFYIFDEDSGIGDDVHSVAEGGLTDGEPMVFLFGNPTKNSGHFHRACFGSERGRWDVVCLDARESKFTNKETIQEWIDTYGEDSDFVRVRVKGLPPGASDLQFIDLNRVLAAQKRVLSIPFADEPLIAGVDVSDGGLAWCVVRFRRGHDGRSIPPVRVPGAKVRNDRGPFLAKLAEILTTTYDGRKVDLMNIDSAFGAPYVERLKGMGFDNVQEIRFGSESLNPHQANRRAYMYDRAKEWLGTVGCIDPKDQILETDLTGPGYHINRQDKLVIESKEDMAKRGVASPDDGDALVLTFATPAVMIHVPEPTRPVQGGWMGV